MLAGIRLLATVFHDETVAEDERSGAAIELVDPEPCDEKNSGESKAVPSGKDQLCGCGCMCGQRSLTGFQDRSKS